METMLVFWFFFASNRDTCLAYYDDRFTTWYCCLVAFHHFFPLKSSSILVAMVMLPYYSAQLVFEVICLPLFSWSLFKKKNLKKSLCGWLQQAPCIKCQLVVGGVGSLAELLNGAENKEFIFFRWFICCFIIKKKNYFKDCAFFLCTSK